MKKDLERLSRYLLIIKKLRSGREIPADELQTAIENDMRLRSWEPTMTLRSLQILADNDEEFRISLDIRITNDFVMVLLARSTSLTVISPAHLRERIADIYRQALSRNG